MPTYQYTCTACEQQLEAVQKFTDDPLTECPQCSGRLRKVFSAVGVVFKGSGFYRTDSRAKSSAADAGKSGGSKDKAESKSEAGRSGEKKAAGSDSPSSGSSAGGSSGTSSSGSGKRESAA